MTKRKIVQCSLDLDGSGAWVLADDGTMWRLDAYPLRWTQMGWPELPPPAELARLSGPTPSEPEAPGDAREGDPSLEEINAIMRKHHTDCGGPVQLQAAPTGRSCDGCRDKLDVMIRHWRRRAAGLDYDTPGDRWLTKCAPYYVDALQSAWMNQFGELLPSEGDLAPGPDQSVTDTGDPL